jgi:CubicO group peptidase (beta-lactamase class C family)
MLLLGELVRRWSGQPFDQHARAVLFEPLGLDDCWIGMPPDVHARYGDRIAGMFDTAGDEPRLLAGLLSAEGNARCVPGGGGRGPMRQLARVLELLRRGGELDGVRVLSRTAVEAMTARHRVGMHDETFGAQIDWGLGLIIDAFPYGRHASQRTYGHGGARSSVAFCDPEHGIVVAAVCNGMPEHQAHYVRQSAITTAIYEDLGIADAAAPGRDHPMPTVGLL